MKYPIIAIIIPVIIAGSSHAVAQSIPVPSADAIVQRLDALDKRNEKLESENAALRDRVRLLEVGKRTMTAAAPPPSAQPASAKPKGPDSAMAMMPKSYAKAPNAYPVVGPYDWTGFYIGANLGGGISDKGWSDPTANPTDLGSHKATGWLAGVQGGYNWQRGNLVLGVEGTYHFADMRGDHQNTNTLTLGSDGSATFVTVSDRYATKIDGIATIAGRVGFASDPIDRTLFYATGGAAYVKESFTQTTNGGELILPAGAPPAAVNFSATRTGSDNRWGWLAGLGLEHGLTENWSARIEYDYLDFGTRSVGLSGIGCTSSGPVSLCAPVTSKFNIQQNMQLLTLGINYRFNSSPVVAKY
jgi:outer membrane immunogenic protein